MKRWARRHARWLIAAMAFAIVCVLRVAGTLQPAENAAADLRARLLSREVDSDIVVVGIDSKSIEALERWPWPRNVHADLLETMFVAGALPARVFIDIDFSSPQRTLDDVRLEQALRDAPVPVQLPVFLSYASGGTDATQVSRPLPQFERHVDLVSVIREAGGDGITRSWRSSWLIDGGQVPSVIDPGRRLADEQEVLIDYSISPASFQYVSYVDVLEGRVPAAELAGRSVYIGNVSAELGDMVAVPGHGALPGVVVQALAAQTVARGEPRVLPGWLSTLLLAALAVLAVSVFRANANRNLVVLGLLGSVIAALSVTGFAWQRLWLDTAAPLLLVLLVFAGVTLLSLGRETTRALLLALGLRRRDALLRSIVQSSTEGILCIDAHGRIRTANPAAARMFGCSTGEMSDRLVGDFIAELGGCIGAAETSGLQGAVLEFDAHGPEGESFPVEVSLSRIRLKSERLYTAIVRDIRERRAQQQRLQYQATHDALTGLPNRAALLARLEASLASPVPQPLAVLMLDLCRFKEVNDALGHHVGDQVLCEVARRFLEQAPAGCMLARIGGDEFTLVMETTQDRARCASVAGSLADSLKTPIDVAGIAVEVGVSIGIARYPDHGGDAPSLLRAADVAMYSSKRRGTASEYYEAGNDENTVRRLAIGGELRAAISSNALELHFQPQVNLKTGMVESCEALVRWFHPVHGAISPAEFIAIAEATDLIRPLTEWTLREALERSRAWRASGLEVRVAVNLSARMLQDTAFAVRLRQLLHVTGVPASALELEITESATMLDPARALRVIQDIHATGVMISIDDFGTGYSSLGYLRDLPVHALKLDQSFVRRMREREGDRIIVESTAQMAQALRLELVAEGVETQWHADVLAAAGYNYAQGWLYSKALPSGQFLAWVSEFNAAALLAGPREARPQAEGQRAEAMLRVAMRARG